MSALHYQTAFDLATSGYRTWSDAAFGLIFVALGALLAWLPLDDPRKARRLGTGMLVSATLWTVVVFAGTYADYLMLASALHNGSAHVTEGRVEQFQPKTSNLRGTPDESFCVDKECFHYSESRVGCAFNQTRVEDGPIREGLAVRVTSYQGKILKLEVAQP